MQAKTLQAATKIVSRIANQSSLTPLYRSVEIAQESIRCCSEFGNIALKVDNTGVPEPCLLDANAMSAVASTLPPEEEITLVKNGNKVNWKAGSAKGHLNLVLSDHAIPTLNHEQFPWTPDKKALSTALRLASSACQAAAVSVGLYGIVLEPIDDKLHLLSSNSISLASATIDKGTYPAGKITLRPPVPGVIAAFIESCPNCAIDIAANGIFIKGDWLQAHLPLAINLEHDLMEVANMFPATTQTAPINSAAVKKFITRARSLSDRNAVFTVNLKVDAGCLILQHSGMASATEEYFLAEGLDTGINYQSVSLPADMLLLPLEAVTTAVFDYMSQSRLILKGTEPDFTYILSGGE